MSSIEIVKGLCNVLLEHNASLVERDDAAMDLGEFDESIALETLCQIAMNDSEDEILLASCGESVAQIWLRREHCDFNLLRQFQKSAQDEALALISSKKPELLSNF